MSLEIHDTDPLPEGWTLVDAVVVMTLLNDDGEVRLGVHTTSGLTAWEALGMLQTTSDSYRQGLLDQPEDGP